MLKGTEALALGLGALGRQAVYIDRGLDRGAALGPVVDLLELQAGEEASRHGESARPEASLPMRTAGAAQAVGLALSGALLSRHPTCAIVSPGGLCGALGGLAPALLAGGYRSAVMLLEGPSEREPEAAAPRSSESYRAPRWSAIDSRAALCTLAQVPTFDPGSPDELYQLLGLAHHTSAAGGLPVVLRLRGRVLAERGEVRLGALAAAFGAPSTETEAAARAFSRDEGPALCTLAAVDYHLRQRASRLARLDAAATALTSRSGGGRRGVLLAGHMGPAVQRMAAGRGLATLRLGLCWPLPEETVCAFLTGLREVLVLEEGAPFLLTHIQALAHRAGLGVRVTGVPQLRQDASAWAGTLAATLEAFGGDRDESPPPPGYDFARARAALDLRPRLRPRPDGHGEIDEEPYGLFLARLRREARAAAGPLLRALSQALGAASCPVLLVGAGAAIHGAPSLSEDLGAAEGAQSEDLANLDVQAPHGAVAAFAGGLCRADALRAGGVALPGRPRIVALLLGEDDETEELPGLLDNASAGRDVLHILAPAAPLLTAARLQALGLCTAVARVPDPGDTEGATSELTAALLYLLARRGPRALLCERAGETVAAD